MSVYSELRDAKQDHDQLRPHLDPDQNKGLDQDFASSKRWLVVGYGLFAMMIMGLIALSW